MPFRNLNDGVTPVVIGGNDWAAAWAMDDAAATRSTRSGAALRVNGSANWPTVSASTW